MEKLKISQVAQRLQVSNQTVYNYLSKFRQALEGNLIRENGKQYLSQDGLKILKNCLGKPDLVEGVKGSQNLESLIVGLKETIDTLIRQHAEERAATAEERRRSDTIILKLTNDIGGLQKQLEYSPIEQSRPKPQEESLNPSALATRRADPRQVVSPPVEKRIAVQRKVSTWESLNTVFDDVMGFAFGCG